MRLLPITAISLAFGPLLGCDQSALPPPQAVVNQQALPVVARQAWNGTIRITESAQNGFSKGDGVMHNSTGTQRALNSVLITLTKGIAIAKIDFELHEQTDQLDHYDEYDLVGKVTEDTLASGINSKDASVKVSLYDDGRYEIEYSSGGVDGRWDKLETSVMNCRPKASDCQPTSSSHTDSAKVTNQGFVSGAVNGILPGYPPKPNDPPPPPPTRLTGMTTAPFDIFSGAAAPGKTTIVWNLSR